MKDCHSIPSLKWRGQVVSVLLPLAFSKTFDYLVTDDLRFEVGSFVEVPFGNRVTIGVIWGAAKGDVDAKKLREINKVIEILPLKNDFRDFINWMSSYTLTPRGRVLRMAMSVPQALRPPKKKKVYRLNSKTVLKNESLEAKIRITENRRRVIDALATGEEKTLLDLEEQAQTSKAVIRAMADCGLLQILERDEYEVVPQPNPELISPSLSRRQKQILIEIQEELNNGFSVTLIDGVTGSGKTEVYFEAISMVLQLRRQVLVLLPEIALTADLLERFQKRFGVSPTLWHSDLSASIRRQNWRAILQGDAKIIVGARSSVMLPYNCLGLIVVDEEHDPSFKQEDGVVYNARDMAVVRAHLEKFPILFSTATPSLETMENVWKGRYRRLVLPERYGGASFPTVSGIDMRLQKMGSQSWLSPTLIEEVNNSLLAGEQAMLFLNRRGYAPLTLCRVCGHRLNCPNCSSWLVEHRLWEKLQCHHCGYSQKMPKKCPNCEKEDTLAACGPGVERLFEEVKSVFPAARIKIMSSDTVARLSEAEELVRQMASGNIDILIGTQIMAKGFNFPSLTFVGVVDSDLGLSGGDLRAAERTYQLLHQVAGRAGRSGLASQVMLQTFQPEHPVMRALIHGTRDQFLEAEADSRRENGMPPYGRLAAVIISGRDQKLVDEAAGELRKKIPMMRGITVLGPAPAPMAVLRGRHRRRLLVRTKKNSNLQEFLRRWILPFRSRGNIRITVDVDPYSFT